MPPWCRGSKATAPPPYDCPMPPSPGALLLCPVCRENLTAGPDGTFSAVSGQDRAPKLLSCTQGHRFDAARQGYFNLLTGRGTSFQPDTAAMVQARIDFLGSGHFRELAEALCAAAKKASVDHPVVLDAGAGTGYYLRTLLEEVPVSTAVALDISKFALRRAAKLVPEALCLVCDLWQPLPVADGSVDLVLNVFAPRNPSEFARIVKDGGILLVVTPLPQHLQEIAGPAGLLGVPGGKGDDVAASLAGAFDLISARTVEFTMLLGSADVRNVAMMGPAGHHHRPAGLSQLPDELPVTAAFTLQSYRRNPRG